MNNLPVTGHDSHMRRLAISPKRFPFECKLAWKGPINPDLLLGQVPVFTG